MIGLTPRDCWEYKNGDLLCALGGLIRRHKNGGRLEIFGLGGSIPVRSGRVGLVMAIRALNLHRGARIGVPLFCCRVVFDAIAAAGCIPCFIDIDAETFCLSPDTVAAKRHQIDALVAVHMFGNLCDISKLREAAHDLPIIEDCAQALGSKLHGRLAGSFGDVAFFSFRSGKYLSIGEGGAVLSQNKEILNRLIQLTGTLQRPALAEEFAHVTKTYIKSALRTKPLYGLIGFQLWQAINHNKSSSEKPAISLTTMFLGDLALFERRLPAAKLAIAKQRANADYFLASLELPHSMVCHEKTGADYNRYHFPVVFSSTFIRNLVSDALFRHQIDTIKYLDDIVSVASSEYGYDGDCPVAERLSRTTLIIPSYHSLSDEELHRIAQCLNGEWKASKDKEQLPEVGNSLILSRAFKLS